LFFTFFLYFPSFSSFSYSSSNFLILTLNY